MYTIFLVASCAIAFFGVIDACVPLIKFRARPDAGPVQLIFVRLSYATLLIGLAGACLLHQSRHETGVYWLRMAQTHDLRTVTLLSFFNFTAGFIVLLVATILCREHPPEEFRIGNITAPICYLWISVFAAGTVMDIYPWKLYLYRPGVEPALWISLVVFPLFLNLSGRRSQKAPQPSGGSPQPKEESFAHKHRRRWHTR
jgi:hypothetical protein